MRTWVAAVLLPILIVGPVLAGKTAVLHAHGDQGGHAHLLGSTPHSSYAAASFDWIEEDHAAIHGHERHDSLPPDAVLRFPEVVTLGAPSGTHAAQSAFELPLPAAIPAIAGAPRVQETRVKGPSPPPPRAARSNITGLLLSSHALLI